MENEKYLLLTFNTVNHTMQLEKELKTLNKKIKTIPTPREVSRSCGLAILMDESDLDTVKQLKSEGKSVDFVWVFEKTKDRGNVVTEIKLND